MASADASADASDAFVLRDGSITFHARILRRGILDNQGNFRPEPIGLALVTQFSEVPDHWNTQPIHVLSIEPGQAVDEWNRRQRAAGNTCVQPGDRLIAVNDAGRHDIIRSELRWKWVVDMTFHRAPPRRAG